MRPQPSRHPEERPCPRSRPSSCPSSSSPKFDLPTFELPKFDLPKFDVPNFEVPDLPTAEQVTSYVRDAAYIGVGLAAMTVERLQALQQQLVELVKERVSR